MKQYMVTAFDYTDEGAVERRMNVRPSHLNGVKTLKENGNFLIGGAMLNDEDKMTGSMMVLQFENEEELKVWQQNEPYITQNIWESVDIKPFRVAVVPQ